MTISPPPFALTDALIFTGDSFVENHALLVRDGHIVDLCSNNKIPDDFEPKSYPHDILSAGLIDCQVNGGDNVLLNATPTTESVLKIAAAHRKKGTTSLLPTCITDTPEIMGAALAATREAAKQDSSILGLHLEGPHISKARKGTHNEAFVRSPNAADLQNLRKTDGFVLLATVAPETVSPEQIRQLVSQGVLVSLGHSDAKADLAHDAFEAGASCVTHLFNAMGPISAREPALAGVALDHKQSWAGLICDNAHVAPELVRLAVRAKAEDKLFMVSDAAAPAAAANPLAFNWSGIMVFPEGNKCINEHGALAGAMLTLGQCVPVAIRDIRLDPERVLRMASTIPAQFLGLGATLGKLLPSYTADIVALDHSFHTVSVWKDGVLQ